MTVINVSELRTGQILANYGEIRAINRVGVFVVVQVIGNEWSLATGIGNAQLSDVIFHETELVTIDVPRTYHAPGEVQDIETGETSICHWCGLLIKAVIDPFSHMVDWGHDGDFGCDYNPESNANGCASHYPGPDHTPVGFRIPAPLNLARTNS